MKKHTDVTEVISAQPRCPNGENMNVFTSNVFPNASLL